MNTHVEGCSVSRGTREMHIKSVMQYHHTLTRGAKIKKADSTQCCRNRNTYTAGTNAEWHGHRGKRSSHFLLCDPANAFPMTTKTHPRKLNAHVHSSRAHNHPGLETVQTATNRSMAGRVTACPDNAILPGGERTPGVAPKASHQVR